MSRLEEGGAPAAVGCSFDVDAELAGLTAITPIATSHVEEREAEVAAAATAGDDFPLSRGSAEIGLCFVTTKVPSGAAAMGVSDDHEAAGEFHHDGGETEARAQELPTEFFTVGLRVASASQLCLCSSSSTVGIGGRVFLGDTRNLPEPFHELLFHLVAADAHT